MTEPTGRRCGRPRKPMVIKMRDNARIKGIPNTEPQPLVSLPECPRHLSTEAGMIWNRFGPMLLKVGLISEIDEASFSLWCASYAELQKLESMAASADRSFPVIVDEL